MTLENMEYWSQGGQDAKTNPIKIASVLIHCNFMGTWYIFNLFWHSKQHEDMSEYLCFGGLLFSYLKAFVGFKSWYLDAHPYRDNSLEYEEIRSSSLIIQYTK